jgi:hypothetical protein
VSHSQWREKSSNMGEESVEENVRTSVRQWNLEDQDKQRTGGAVSRIRHSCRD